MILTFKLKENDFFLLQLYIFKREVNLSKLIIKELAVWFVIFLTIILFLYFNNQKDLALFISIGAIIGLIIRPFRIKKNYFNRSRKQIKIYENRFNKTITLEFLDDYINFIGSDSESKINLSAIKKIIDTKQHYLLTLNPEIIIIPKSEIENEILLRNELIKLSKKQKIEFENQQNWKW